MTIKSQAQALCAYYKRLCLFKSSKQQLIDLIWKLTDSVYSIVDQASQSLDKLTEHLTQNQAPILQSASNACFST